MFIKNGDGQILDVIELDKLSDEQKTAAKKKCDEKTIEVKGHCKNCQCEDKK